MTETHIGTSGWFYDHWEKVFYPEKLSKSERLGFYSEYFSVVEINNTFYRLPTLKAVENWYSKTPKSFQFSVKVSRYITHLKRLKDCQSSIDKFLKRIGHLKEKLGPLLFQFPPSFHHDIEHLERVKAFIQQLPKEYSYTFEFRHSSWFVEETYALLREFKVALCITDLNGELSPVELTAPFAYVRLHGPKSAYRGSYSFQKLKQWKERILEWKKQNIAAYCFFDNDEKAFAVADALRLKRLIDKDSTPL